MLTIKTRPTIMRCESPNSFVSLGLVVRAPEFESSSFVIRKVCVSAGAGKRI